MYAESVPATSNLVSTTLGGKVFVEKFYKDETRFPGRGREQSFLDISRDIEEWDPFYLTFYLFLKSYHPIPLRDSISRPIAPVSSMAGGDDNTM
jgi:hypothetical protein